MSHKTIRDDESWKNILIMTDRSVNDKKICFLCCKVVHSLRPLLASLFLGYWRENLPYLYQAIPTEICLAILLTLVKNQNL